MNIQTFANTTNKIVTSLKTRRKVERHIKVDSGKVIERDRLDAHPLDSIARVTRSCDGDTGDCGTSCGAIVRDKNR